MSKIAVAGKGGVGKTTFSSLLAYVLAAAGQTVYAIDADPNPTLGEALGFPDDLLEQLVPIIDMKELVEERTGARPGESGAYFRLNPRVDDIPARFSVSHRGIRLLKMGTVKGAGAGCVCPENTMVQALVTHLLLREQETVLLDMVAGLEHLGRGTAASVDAMFIVVEPGQRSMGVGADIARLGQELGDTGHLGGGEQDPYRGRPGLHPGAPRRPAPRGLASARRPGCGGRYGARGRL